MGALTAEQRAQLAMSLRDNEVFQEALDAIREASIGALIAVSPDDKNTILKAQAEIAVVDELRANLDGFVRSAELARKRPSIA